ncbi:neuronal acetylcholine receptor subunit non-alpha-2-like [Battus philenor]|uniref:neuronal acetylcholine receptor subunit non-alpha-2-like n=1 Tax=Battus philenor TaxID=42288 RepID=UPI0035D0C7E7
MIRKIVTVVIIFWIYTAVVVANYTFSYDIAKRCREHICQHGYSYDTYYRVDSSDRRRLKSEPELAFEMHLAILASSNGHILLSTVAQPTTSDPVYEIVIGGGGNKFTELRRNFRRNARASYKTIGILSPIEFRAFYIKISEDGLIEFGKEGEPLPVISYYDVDPLPIKYFSFAAWNGVEAKFLYDCPAPGDNDTTTTPHSEEVEHKQSNSDSLRTTLLMGRMPHLAPSQNMNVKLGIKITSLRYNALDAKLTTGLAVFMSWVDNSMAWDPSKFNGTTSLSFRQGQIWRPTFFVFNSDDLGMLDAKNPDLIWMVNSGEAVFHFQTTLYTWCFDYSTTLNRWPRDEYQCAIAIQPWETHERIFLSVPTKEEVEGFTDIDDVIQNEWEIDVKQYIVSQVPKSKSFVNGSGGGLDVKSEKLHIKINLKRRATSYNIVFYTPLLVLVLFVLLSFWTEPLKMDRVWFYAGCTIVICLGLCYVDYLIPCHTIPTILVLYTAVLIGVLIALIVHVLLMTAMAEKICQKPFINTILIQRWFRGLFCLSEIKMCRIYQTINERNPIADDDDSGVCIAPRLGNVEEMESDNAEYNERRDVAQVLDKILFFVYSITFAVLLGLHF